MTEGNVSPPRLPILVAAGFTIGPVLHSITEHALKRFSERGYDVTLVPFDMKDMTDVQRYAAHIESEALRVADERHVEKLNIVAMSMGGVASLYGLKRGGLLRLTETCTTVGSPFFGSRLSLLAHPTVTFAPLKLIGIPLDVSRVGRQLCVGSMFLRHLHADPLPEGLPFVSIAGSNDYICPPKTALLPGSTQRTLAFSHHDIIRAEWLHKEAFSHCR